MDRKGQIAYRYARALARLPGQNGELFGRHTQMDDICRYIHQSGLFKKILFSPRITLSEKNQFLNKCLAQKVDPYLMQFLSVLIDNGRISLLDTVAAKYKEIVFEELGIIEVMIVAASPLDETEVKKLIQKMEKKYRHTVHIEIEIRPELLGGVQLMFNNKMIKNSIKDRLSKIKRELLAVAI